MVVGSIWIDGPGQGLDVGACVCGDEPSGPKKC